MRKIAVAVVSMLVLCPSVEAGGEPPVSIKLPGSCYISTPGHVTKVSLVIRIAPNPNNKAIRIEWESDASSGSSGESLNGERSPKVIQRFIALVRGDYTVRVLINDGNTGDDETIISSASTVIRDQRSGE